MLKLKFFIKLVYRISLFGIPWFTLLFFSVIPTKSESIQVFVFSGLVYAIPIYALVYFSSESERNWMKK